MKYTVTIGIPAYNEEANIGHLLDEILKQVIINYELESIIIASDGSTDKTAQIVQKFTDNRIKFIDNKDRQGPALRQNQIKSLTSSDVLILLNADISIPDTMFIEELINPIRMGKADLVTPAFKQLSPKTYIESILYTSMNMKTEAYEKYKEGMNVYTCCGPARAFSKKLYTSLNFKRTSGEDAYSYLYTLKHGFKYFHTKETSVFFRLPNTIKDHSKQSVRFLTSRKELEKEFGKDFVKNNYKFSFMLGLKVYLNYLLKYPLRVAAYSLIFAIMTLISLWQPTAQAVWEISKSSKNLR